MKIENQTPINESSLLDIPNENTHNRQAALIELDINIDNNTTK